MEKGVISFLTEVCDAAITSRIHKIESKKEEPMRSEEAQFLYIRKWYSLKPVF